ncbi:MAG TPA: ATP-binding protein [Candidatus Omnitrophota bacterium]|nr:ATP-binding protein [Candidatus Omnitrophota bacterium]HQJ14953.1 ATP-binding protein [Candidatus Omnitrophota bacterium]
MRIRTFEFKISVLYAAVLGTGLSIYIGILFILPPDVLQRYALAFVLFPIPLTLVFGSFVGRMVTAGIMRPVKEMTDIANSITHEDLSLRVKIDKADAELRSLIEAFNDMVSRLEEAFAYITDSSSYIAHELKTPIAIIRGESEFALKKERGPDEYRRVISVSLDETKRMLKIIEDLLLLTKMNYQPDVLTFERIDLTAFVTILFEQAKILAAKKNITVAMDIPDRTAIVNGDELHLRRLLLNLIDNAVKFTPEAGSIRIGLAYDGDRADISISDSGIGISKENLPKLFDKFFRIDGQAKDTSPSSGLGLSIAQSIAELHQGRISVASEPGKGSVFTVSLPIL